MRQTFRHADVVGDKTVFNIKGNDYRLIVHIRYDLGIIYVKGLLTHAEYDKETWKNSRVYYGGVGELRDVSNV